MNRLRNWMVAVPVAGLVVAGAVGAVSAAQDANQGQRMAPKQGGSSMSCCAAMMGGMGGGMGGAMAGKAKALPLSQKIDGGVTVVLDSKAKPPQAGENAFLIRLQSAGGQPINDARVTLALSMPSMNMGGPTVTAKHTAGGLYATTANLSMAGPWQAKVSVARPGQQRTVASTFDFQALQKGAAAAAPSSQGAMMMSCPMMASGSGGGSGGGSGMKDCPMMGSSSSGGHAH